MTNEERKELEEYFDERYVRKDDCTERQAVIDTRFANNATRNAIVAHDVAAIKKVLWFVAGAIVSEVVVMLFSIIMK